MKGRRGDGEPLAIVKISLPIDEGCRKQRGRRTAPVVSEGSVPLLLLVDDIFKGGVVLAPCRPDAGAAWPPEHLTPEPSVGMGRVGKSDAGSEIVVTGG